MREHTPLLLIVTDDDGANDSYEIEIVILSDSETENDSLSTGSVIVLIGIIGFSVIMYRRINKNDRIRKPCQNGMIILSKQMRQNRK